MFQNMQFQKVESYQQPHSHAVDDILVLEVSVDSLW